MCGTCWRSFKTMSCISWRQAQNGRLKFFQMHVQIQRKKKGCLDVIDNIRGFKFVFEFLIY
jgi:hypothetical protein